MIKGKKTYIVCALAIIYALTGVATGNLEITQAVETILAALGAASLRNAL